MLGVFSVGLSSGCWSKACASRKRTFRPADMYDAESDTADDVAERFKDFEVKIIDLNEGTYLDDDALKTAGIPDRNAYDASQATKNQALSEDLGDNDPAGIGRKPKYAKVYVKNDDAGQPETVVLPIQGYGLWGTIYGFLTLESDMNTIKGISFYEHKETPGLGARIEEPEWRAKWSGIESYDENGNVATGVTKAGNPKENWVDGISGATLTSRGVSNMIQFWLGEQGYKPYLDTLREKSGQTVEGADTQANQSKPAAQPKTELAAKLPVANGKEA